MKASIDYITCSRKIDHGQDIYGSIEETFERLKVNHSEQSLAFKMPNELKMCSPAEGRSDAWVGCDWVNKRVQVSIPGSGCGQLWERLGSEDTGHQQDLIQTLLNASFSFSRLDFAFDDTDALLTFSELEECAESGSLRGDLSVYESRSKTDVSTGEVLSRGFVLMNRTKSMQVSVYDKGLQRSEKTALRVEVRYRKASAKRASVAFARDGINAIVSDLLAHLTFLSPAGSAVLECWAKFLGTAIGSKLRNPLHVVPRNVDRQRDIFIRQCSGRLYGFSTEPDVSCEVINLMLRRGQRLQGGSGPEVT